MFHLEKRQLRQFSLICAAAALAVVLITLFIVFLTSGQEDEPPAPSSSGVEGPVIPEGMRLFEDLYEGEVIIPDFDVPDNKLDFEGFTTGPEGRLEYKGAVLGVDVSEFQGEVDWYAVKAAGVQFAMLRTGYRGMTQGLLKEDQSFRQHLEEAANAGLDLGVYFFSQAVTPEEAKAEAEFVVEQLEGVELTYPVVFDWEDPVPTEELPANTLRAYGLSGQVVSQCAQAFCQTVKKAGYTPCVYFNKHQAYFFYDLDLVKDYDFWYAEYNPLPACCYGFRMWQYSDSGTIPGIETTVDLNLCFKPYE